MLIYSLKHSSKDLRCQDASAILHGQSVKEPHRLSIIAIAIALLLCAYHGFTKEKAVKNSAIRRLLKEAEGKGDQGAWDVMNALYKAVVEKKGK